MNTLILVISVVAGVVGTGLGGIFGALLKNRDVRVMGKVLGFAGGVMVGVVAFEMIPEAVEGAFSLGKIGGIAVAVGSLVAGIAAIFGINRLLDFAEHKKHKSDDDVYRALAVVQAHTGYGKKKSANAAVCKETNSASKSNGLSSGSRRELIKAGTVMLIAIALHNFPEGMAIGASGAAQVQTGVLVAVIIAVHNIPEGMAIAAPLVGGGVNGAKAVALTALAGGATVVGALIGLAVGGLGDIATGVCLSLASGAMLYVTFCDIFPQAIALNGGRVPSASFVTGIVFSIIFVFAF